MSENIPGIIVVSHGLFCVELIKSAEMIFGELEKVKAVALKGDMAPEVFTDELSETCREFDNNVIILADIFSGTPFRVSAMLSQQIRDMVLITGVNMPMLISAVELRKYIPKHELADQLVCESKDSIQDVMKALGA